VLEWLKTSTQDMVEKDSARYSLQCCVCWEGPLFNSQVKGHAALTCPLLATFNRVRSEPMSHLWAVVVGRTQVHIYRFLRQSPHGPMVGI
jgi:hypothetical protein